ncbi:hypothetical protein [Acidithiobacillus sp.]
MDAIPTYCSKANMMFLFLGAGEIEMLVNGPLILIKAMQSGGLGSERRGLEKKDEGSAVRARGGT